MYKLINYNCHSISSGDVESRFWCSWASLNSRLFQALLQALQPVWRLYSGLG